MTLSIQDMETDGASGLYPTSNPTSGADALEETRRNQGFGHCRHDHCGTGSSCSCKRSCSRAGTGHNDLNDNHNCHINNVCHHYNRHINHDFNSIRDHHNGSYSHGDHSGDDDRILLYLHTFRWDDRGDEDNLRCDDNSDVNKLQSNGNYFDQYYRDCDINGLQPDRHNRDDSDLCGDDCPFDEDEWSNDCTSHFDNMDDSDRHHNSTDCDKHSDGNSYLTHNNERNDNDHLYCDGSYPAYSSAYTWFPVGIDLGRARARSAGRASDL